MVVYEVAFSTEYYSDHSLGLFATLDVVRKHYSHYSVELTESLWARPEYADLVREAYGDGRENYWWYDLPRHGSLEHGTGHMFITVTELPVRDSESRLLEALSTDELVSLLRRRGLIVVAKKKEKDN